MFFILLVSLTVLFCAAQQNSGQYTISDATNSILFDGIGASFSGASARLIRDYPSSSRTRILDLLFSPSGPPSTQNNFKGAALQILKLPIGGDGSIAADPGTEPSHMHSLSDSVNLNRGWVTWLAREALDRNPNIKILLTPRTFPGYLRQGNADATDPFGDPLQAASYVFEYVIAFADLLGVHPGYVGLWSTSSATSTVVTNSYMVQYAVELRAQLDSVGLTDTLIVCSDSASRLTFPPITGDWSCVNATDPSDPLYNDELAQVVGVIGNLGRPPIPFSSTANPNNIPVWMTSYTSEYSGPQQSFGYGALSVANEWMETYLTASSINKAKQGSIPSGFIYEYAVDAAPYGFPNFYYGLIQANQPWSGHFSVSPALWAIAHVNQFVPANLDWRILAADATNGGSGNLTFGGYYTTFYSPTTFESTIIVNKFYDMNMPKRPIVSDELATFTWNGNFPGKQLNAAVWYSCFSNSLSTNNTWTTMTFDKIYPLLGNSITLNISTNCIYSISTSQAISVWPGCQATDCETLPPDPLPFGNQAITFTNFKSCVFEGANGLYMMDINGVFECATDLLLGMVLKQTAEGVPIPAGDTRPHTITGDFDTINVDVRVDAYIPGGCSAMIGANINPYPSEGGAQLNIAAGLWLVVQPVPENTLFWKLVTGLDTTSYEIPVRSGEIILDRPLESWVTLRLIVRDGKAIGTVSVSPTLDNNVSSVLESILLFTLDISNGYMKSGFVGFGSGEFVSGTSFRNFNVTNSATTCSAVPVETQPVLAQMCQSGSAGQVFEISLQTPPEPSSFGYDLISKYDSWDEDCGPIFPSQIIGDMLQACATNYSAGIALGASCSCSGFNSNGYPKGRFDDINPYYLMKVDLYVLQLPPSQIKLSANTSLCLDLLNDQANPSLYLNACADPSVGPIPLSQLWTFERSIADGVYLSGPLGTQDGLRVADISGFSFEFDNPISADSYSMASSQIFTFPFPDNKGIIRASQMGLCLGACSSQRN
jgi:hypothetical protein